MDFGCEVSRLAQKAYPEFPYEALDQVSREQFVRGLSDVDMKRHVDLRNPSSLEEAISLATQFESFDIGEGHGPTTGRGETRPSRGRTAPVLAEEQPTSKPEKSANEEITNLRKQIESLRERESKAERDSKTIVEMDQKITKLTEQVENLTKLGLAKAERQSYQPIWMNRPDRSRNQSNGNRIPKGNCFACGQPGHYKNACPKIRKTQNNQKNEQQETSSSRARRLVVSKGGWLVPGVVEGVEVEMLVDSGSDVTLVDSRFYHSIPAYTKPRLVPSTCSLNTASGSAMSPEGEAKFQIKLDNQTWCYPVIVSKLGSTKVIIGNDFLTDNECLIDLRLGLLRIEDEKVLMRRERTAEFCCRVRLAEPVEIPPSHEVRLPGIIDKASEDCNISKQGLVQPIESLMEETGLFMGTSLVDTSKTLVPVTLLNLGDKMKQLPRGMTIGVVEQVEETTVVGEDRGTPTAETQLQESNVKHLADMLNRMGSSLSSEQARRVKEVVAVYSDVFASPDGELGHTTLVQHTIDTGDNHPIKQPPRRLPVAQREIADKEVEKMLLKGFIEPSDSPWASPIVLVAKKDGSTRFCIDYRRLNDVTRKDSFPLPRIDETIESLAGAEWFSTLDLVSGYWQVSVAHGDREKTAFVTRKGLFQWKVMPFGLANAPATFSRLMEMVLRGINWERCLVYLDDIIVFGRSFDQALTNLVQVFECLRQAGLRLKPSKCSLFQNSVKFLGHVVSKDGVACDPEKIDCVRDWETPKCVTEVRSFVGFASYYRRFIPHFAHIAAPLVRLTEKNTKFYWDDSCVEAFNTLKEKLIEAPVLAYPQPEGLLILDTDASNVSISGCLSQVQDGVERVLAYGSKALSSAQRRYCTTKRELLAVVKFIKHYRMYLWGRRFLVRTDHASLRWLTNFKDPEGMLARWISVLDTYDFTIQHRPGAKHSNADGLTRQKCTQCKRQECEGRSLRSQEIKILVTYEDTLDLHEQYNISQEEDFLQLPIIDTNTPETEKLTAIIATTKADELSNEKQEPNWLGSWTIDELRQYQDEDSAIKTVKNWIEKGSTRPKWTNITAEDGEVKALWSQWESLEIRKSILYRKFQTETKEEPSVIYQYVAPKRLRKEIMRHLHDHRTGGHLGITKTLYNVRQRFYWPGSKKDIVRWCHHCKECGARKPKHGKRAPLQQEVAGMPMERIALDIMGPLPRSNSGNSYILVIGDYFTKWTQAHALPDHTAQTVAKIVVEEWIRKMGVPRVIHSDQGPDFESNLFQEMCRLLEIDKTRTCPYRPQSDGMIERFN